MHKELTKWLKDARRLHAESIVVDSHCDTTQYMLDSSWDFSARHGNGHVDIPRLREGGMDAVVMAVYAGGPLPAGEGPKAARAQLDAIDNNVSRHSRHIRAARTAEDVRTARFQQKIAILKAIEGGYLIDDSFEILREYHRRGAVYLTLTHSFHTSWADSSGVHEEVGALHGGLTSFGREVVRELNRLGMMVDVSHASDDTFWNVMETSRVPVIASHSSCRAVSPHRRNLSDEMMKAIAKSGGVIQINFAAAFVDPTFPSIDPQVLEYWASRGGFAASPYARHDTPYTKLIDHFDHAIHVVGYDYVGIGSDFDGVSALPRGMENVSRLVYLTAELLRRGHAENDLAKVLGANFLRTLERCQSLTQDKIPDFRLRIILASASPRRAQLLAEHGYEFEVVPPPDEEPPVPQRHGNAAEWARTISLGKARSVAAVVRNGLILAGDTIAVLGERVIGKPINRSHAEEILRSLSGTTHQVISALTLLDAASGQSMVKHAVTHVRMRTLGNQEICKYLDSGEWEGKAGAYGIQDHGDRFVEYIDGSFSNVVGLPMELLHRMLKEWQPSSP